MSTSISSLTRILSSAYQNRQMEEEFNPDSAVAIGGHRSTVLGEDTKLHSNNVRECKNDFATSPSDAFAAPGLHLAPDIFGLTAESGFNVIL